MSMIKDLFWDSVDIRQSCKAPVFKEIRRNRLNDSGIRDVCPDGQVMLRQGRLRYKTYSTLKMREGELEGTEPASGRAGARLCHATGMSFTPVPFESPRF